jgi:hypothetical protein
MHQTEKVLEAKLDAAADWALETGDIVLGSILARIALRVLGIS